MTTSTSAKIVSPSDIMSPREVLKIMPSSITIGWLYSHWPELGGVTIGNKKLIKRGILDAHLEGKQEVLHKGKGADSRKQKVSEAQRFQLVSTQLENGKRSDGGRVKTEGAGSAAIQRWSEDDPYNLIGS